jgi:hypothetical protein
MFSLADRFLSFKCRQNTEEKGLRWSEWLKSIRSRVQHADDRHLNTRRCRGGAVHGEHRDDIDHDHNSTSAGVYVPARNRRLPFA